MNGASAPLSGGLAAQRNPRLLLVEDDPSTRSSLQEALEDGYEVEAAQSGEEAWEAAQRQAPDLVLSEMLLPGLDGIELTRRLRADVRTATVPIVLLTASREQETLRRGLEAGADDFLAKPCSVPELLARLRCHRRLVELRWEAQARQSGERYRLIVESARDYAIFTFDGQRRVTSWNAGAEAMTGFAPADIVGQLVDLVFTPEDCARGVPAMEGREAQKTGRWYNERWHMKKDGSRFWGSGVVMPLREEGPGGGNLKILRDLTAAHEADGERTRLLEAEQTARQEAEAANQTKDRFLASLSHELRTPLAPVQMALYIMGREKNLPASLREGIELIRRNVDVEVRLIGDLLDVSRITHGKLELNREPLDLHACILHALEVCAEDFTAKSLKLSVDLAARQHRVLGEATRLQQVFWNLLKNAAKFTPDGGEITVRSNNVGEEVAVEVQDTGLGIEAEALTKIFEPFEQGGAERTRRFGGLGLGLAISQAIVAAHDGQLTAESAGRNQGSTFRVQLSTM